MAIALTFTVPARALYTRNRIALQVSIPSAKSTHRQVPHSIRCIGANPNSNEKIIRRSANYQPSIWDNDFVQSLNSKYSGDTYVTHATKLKEDVKKLFKEKIVNSLDGLELIDDLQRLGIFYHFEDEIKRVLESICKKKHDGDEDDLCATSLKFRVFRQHGYNISQEVFNNFMDGKGHFKASLCQDIRGILYLYEASFLSFSNETILEVAKDFATKILEQYLKRKDIDQDLAVLISHALERPLHWRMPRSESRWFTSFCERRLDMNHTLLDFAKLDFNMVQAIHQEEIKQLSRWWNENGLAKKLSFCRDRLVVQFLWIIETNFKPESSNLRRNLTAMYTVDTYADDIYDVYGTLDELEVFSDALERWDIGAVEQLPEYMKIYFLAFFNFINEMAYETLKEQGVYIIPLIQKTWADYHKVCLEEARWRYSGYIPTLEERIENGRISCGAGITLIHAYFSTNPINMEEGLDWIQNYPNVMRWFGTIGRFAGDLATAEREMKSGGPPTTIQCYMNETGVSEKSARDHIKYLIENTWKKMNEDHFADSLISPIVAEAAINLCRGCMCVYHYEDANSIQGPQTIKWVSSVLIDPIPLGY